jgi:hypothetical protein
MTDALTLLTRPPGEHLDFAASAQCLRCAKADFPSYFRDLRNFLSHFPATYRTCQPWCNAAFTGHFPSLRAFVAIV